MGRFDCFNLSWIEWDLTSSQTLPVLLCMRRYVGVNELSVCFHVPVP